MTFSELNRQVGLIRLRTRRPADNLLAGKYHSAFKGPGLEFAGVREYAPGDEVRTIDWNVTARTGRPHVRCYTEERQSTVVFLVDLSGSTAFGSGRRKSDVAAEICGLLAFSAIRNGDKVGLIAFTERVELYVPPRRHVSHALRLIRDLLHFQPAGRRTDLKAALQYLSRVLHRRAVVFLVSDLMDEGFERELRTTAKRHDLIAISITDPREQELPSVGLLDLVDAESGERVLVDTSDASVRQHYGERARTRESRTEALLASASVDHIRIVAGCDYIPELVRFFSAHGRRR